MRSVRLKLEWKYCSLNLRRLDGALFPNERTSEVTKDDNEELLD